MRRLPAHVVQERGQARSRRVVSKDLLLLYLLLHFYFLLAHLIISYYVEKLN